MRHRVATFWIILALAGPLAGQSARAFTNGVALTPPMGFNSWYAYGAGMNETLLKSIADTMAANGMLAAGYQYINIDDGWPGYRDTNGVMVADTNKYPSGIKALADYVHAKGFKFGLYTTAGTNTCAGYPASVNHIVQDANTYASWGVDYVKYEGCDVNAYDLFPHEQAYAVMMSQALAKCGRPIVFSCSVNEFESWMPQYINLWRCTGDIDGQWSTVLRHIDIVAASAAFAGPGSWNDPDVIEIGSGYFNGAESTAIFSMWCMLSSPLIVLGSESAHTNILCNTEAIAVDQDPAGVQGLCVASNGNLQVWRKPMGGSTTNLAVTLFNRGDTTASITANWSDLGLPTGVATLRDVWAHAYVGSFTNNFTALVPAHGVQMVRLVYGTTMQRPPVGTNYLSALPWLADETNTTIFDNGVPFQLDESGALTPITLHGVVYPKGLGMIPYTLASYFLGGGASRFQSDVGLDDIAGSVGSVVFRLYADGVQIYDSGAMTTSTPTQHLDLDMTGVNVLTLEVLEGVANAPNGYADWAGARIIAAGLPPSVPAGLSAAATTTQFNLSWYQSYGATSYNLKRSSVSGGSYVTITNTITPAFVDANISSGATYYYVVSATNSYGESSNSPEISVAVTAYWTNSLTSAPQAWNFGGNWSTAPGFPNAIGTLAVITNAIAANQTINLNQDITIGAMILGAANGSSAFNIAPNGGTLIFSNSGNPVTLTETPSSAGDTLSAPLTLNGNLSVSNASTNLLTLSGAISGPGSLAQNGPGALLLGGSNSFAAATVTQGLLKIGNNFALGTNSGATVATGATVDLNGFNLGAARFTVSGAGLSGNGAIISSAASGQTNALQFLTLANDTTIGGAARWDLRGAGSTVASAALSTGGNHFNLAKKGGNQISLASVSVDAALGNIDIQQGTLEFEWATTSMGNPGAALTVEPGASLAFSQTTTPWNKIFSLNGDGLTTTVTSLGGTNTAIGPATLNGAVTFGVAGGVLQWNGSMTGTGSFNKTLGGTLSLGGTNGYTGNFKISGGALAITSAAAIASSPSLNIAAGALLDVSALANGLTLSAGQSLGGSGAVAGKVTVGSGATLAPSNSFQVLTFSNALTLGSNGLCVMAAAHSPASNETVTVLGTLTYGGKLQVANPGPAAFAAGDTFKLFNAAAYTGKFASITPQIPGPLLVWDTSGLATNGTLRVAAGNTPHFTAATPLGNSISFAGSGGATNGMYYVLNSTNLAIPLSQWPRVATNHFDASGNFAFTNAVSPQSRASFYTVQLP